MELRAGLTTKQVKKKKEKSPDVGVGSMDAEICDLAFKVETRVHGREVKDILVNGGSAINAMSEKLMKKLGLQLTRPSSITVRMTNRQRVKPLGVIEKTYVSVMGIQVNMDFQVLKESSYGMLLGRPWLVAVRDEGEEEHLEINVMDLFPEAEVIKDPDKNDLSPEEIERRLAAEVTLEQHKIELEDGAKPIRQKQRRVSPSMAEMVKEEINKLRVAGFIHEIENSEWVSPIVVVRKKNGKLRVCIDYKKLNAVTKKDYYPLPFIEVSGHEWYNFGDGYNGYNQVKIAPEHQKLTTFTTPWGTFVFRVMPFGLCNALSTFQWFMNKIFEPFIGVFVRDFIDDFCVYSSKADHFDHLKKVLEMLDQTNASLNPEKCIFGCEEGLLLGHIISKDGIAVDLEKVKKIMELPFPVTLTKLRQFLGIVGYYRRFILAFSHKAHALTSYLKKGKDYVVIFADEDALVAFEDLKKALVSAPILIKPDWSKPFIVYTDASSIALGSTLSQNDAE
ncbi:hypothetical protein R1sor_006880 [Riccia sorocarpa]|uniref:Reverse transcriptase domain-containing protein n=1 Tax=Riccia sorocarpa TaxID=122646 RepID=A0ABD3HV49_9MARC